MAATTSLDIDLLRSFVLIAEGGSFTRAAARVGRTQAAISLQVQRLEALVGHQLFVRSRGGGVQLTRQGLYLLDRARDLVALNDDIVGSLRAQPRQDGMASVANETITAATLPAQGSPNSQPSIAVLPFQNMTGDPDQEFFADGVVDDIVAGLSRIKWLLVIARNSTLAYKGRAVDVRQVGRELGVRYVLQGGVRKVGNTVRIVVQLLDVTSKQLWADKFDGKLEDAFDFQDQIADQVVGIIEPRVQRSEIEHARRQRPANLDAYHLYLRALPHVEARMPERISLALPLLQQAHRLDPDYAAVHALLGFCHEQLYARGGFDAAQRGAALEHARAAIDSHTDDPFTLAMAGFTMALGGDEQEAGIGQIDRALALNPACATALYIGAQAHAIAGHGEVATLLAGRALRLSPFDPLAFEAHLALGETAVGQGRYNDAAACFARAGQSNINFSTTYLFQAIAMALADRADHTSHIVKRGLELEPDFRFRFVFEHGFAQPIAAELVEGSRKLGLRE